MASQLKENPEKVEGEQNVDQVEERIHLVEQMLLKEEFQSGESFKSEFDWDSRELIGKVSADGAKSVFQIKRKKDNKIFAIKIWQNILELNVQQITSMTHLHNFYYHTNILNYIGLYSFKENMGQAEEVIIIATMEYYPETLRLKMEKQQGQLPSDIETIYLLQSGIKVIQYLKQLNKTSLFNIKPDNISVSKEGTYVFSDFGQCQINNSNISQHEVVLKQTQASIYLSQEFYQGIKSQKEKVKLNFEKVDIFALGAVVLEFSVGKLPKVQAPMKKSDWCKLIIKSNGYIRKIIPQMLHDSMESRIIAQDIIQQSIKGAKLEGRDKNNS